MVSTSDSFRGTKSWLISSCGSDIERSPPGATTVSRRPGGSDEPRTGGRPPADHPGGAVCGGAPGRARVEGLAARVRLGAVAVLRAGAAVRDREQCRAGAVQE